MTPYLILFASAFGAATLLPFYSELLLLAQLNEGLSPFWLWIAASSGNTLGSGVNWWMGKRISDFVGRRWFPVKEQDLVRAQNWFNRYGKWSLLMAWLPIGGDALTVVGSIMHIPAPVFFTLVAIGKSLRYALVILGYQLA